MKTLKVAYFSEMDFGGSGYSHITIQLCNGLAERGHDVKALCLSYKGQEHPWPFSALPCNDVQEAIAMFHNLVYVWKPDVLIVALDIPYQEKILGAVQKYDIPYIGIMPLESGPLCMEWAMALMQMKKTFFMSQFGADEANEVGVPAEHLRLGVDTVSWKLRTPEERKALRQALLGIEDDETFVILTVADNQERKNLSAAMEIVRTFQIEVTDNYRYILVTRPRNQIGWRLRDLARRLGIDSKYIEFDRTTGISFKELWSLYACADAFLLTSKAEGYGFPVVESMAVGVPVIGTETGAIIEHITEGGGWLIEPEYSFVDPYGNAERYFINIDDAVSALTAIREGLDVEETVERARAYVESRTWDFTVDQLDKACLEVANNEQKEPAAEPIEEA